MRVPAAAPAGSRVESPSSPVVPLDDGAADGDDHGVVRFLAAFVGALAVLAPAAAVGRGAGVATSLHTYTPFTGRTIARDVRVGRTAHGYCWTTSSADARSDAFRCFVGNEIYDPCFAGSGAASTYVLCPLYTPGASALRIDLTKRLPAAMPSVHPRRYEPWAVQLSSGKWCTVETGATGSIDGLPVSYGCVGGGMLLGTIKRSPGGWTAFYAASARTTRTPRVALRSAWW